MLAEVLIYLGLDAHLNTRKKIVDATVGAGGYSYKFCKCGAEVLGIEADREMMEIAQALVGRDCPSFKLVHGNFANISEIVSREGFSNIDGIVYDLGVATEQLTDPNRGISFKVPEAPLDMRLDPETQKVTARDLLNALNKGALSELFLRTCEPHETRKLVKRVLEGRESKPFRTVGDLLDITRGIFKFKPGINPATKPFLALRIAVNSEIDNLEKSLKQAEAHLGTGGRIIVISFHSGEDAVVKKLFNEFASSGFGTVVTRKPVLPRLSEVRQNPKARSAKLRVFEKI